MARTESPAHSARCARAIAACLGGCFGSGAGWGAVLALGATGCGEAAVDVVAVWVDGVSDGEGNRNVRIYDAGERRVLPIIPDIPGSGIELLQVGVDPRGRGVAVSGTTETVWIERDSGRSVTLGATSMGRNLVAPGFSFTTAGDAILRALDLEPEQPPAWLLAPLSGPAALQVHVLEPPRGATALHQWSLHYAADAPVVMWAEIGSSALDGELLALAYPSDEGEGPWVDDLRPLGRGIVVAAKGLGYDPSFLPGCADRLCVAPSGRVAHVMASSSGCALLRWSWEEAESTAVDTPPTSVRPPCPTAEQIRLVAVLEDDVVVMDDLVRIHLIDLGAGTVRSLPKPAGELALHVVDRGHGLVISSSDGSVARVDASGPRMVSGVQSPCLERDGFAVSPSGVWVVQSCNGQNGAPAGVDGQIQRISVLGTESYSGVPMRPIAIDDEGNALLYSFSSDDDDGVPRGLFVLTGDGQLMRVDELEPFPARVLVEGVDGELGPGRFAAGGPS